MDYERYRKKNSHPSKNLSFSASVVAMSSISVKRLLHSATKIDLRGVFVPLTTPFLKDQSINYEGLKSNLAKYEKIPFKGYVVAGSNGEAPYLSPQERVELVKFVRENSSKSRVVIGGATAESTLVASNLAKEMCKVGADGVLVMPPFYFKKQMTANALKAHYSTVAEKGGLPVIIYNMPIVTGIDIETQTLAELAHHPLIVGVKDSDIRKCAGTVQDTAGLDFSVLIGSAGYLLGSLLNGCSGGINGLAGVLGKEICEIYDLVQKGKLEEAANLQRKISKMDILLLSKMGVPGLKVAMDFMGLCGGQCRKPIQPTEEKDKKLIEQALTAAGY